MKKLIPFLIGALVATCSANAQESLKSDTTVHFNNKTIQIEDSVFSSGYFKGVSKENRLGYFRKACTHKYL